MPVIPVMEKFLTQLGQLILEQDLSIAEIIGALELAKAEILSDAFTATESDET